MRSVVLIVAAGLAVRLLLLALFDPSQAAAAGDAPDYLHAAQLLRLGVQPETTRALGYPLFLVPLLPVGVAGIVVVQCCVTIGSAVATWALLGRERVALWTGLLIATSPFLALFDFLIRSETLYVELLWLGFLLLYLKRFWWSALLIGLAILARDTLILLPLALIPLTFRDRRYLVPILAASLIGATPTLLTATPGRFGLNLWIGTWERNGDWYRNALARPQFPPYAFRLPNERNAVESAWNTDDVALARLAVRRIKAHPFQTLATWAVRYPRMWIGTRTDAAPMRLPRHSPAWWTVKLGFLALNLVTLGFGFYGMARRPELLAIPIVYIALVYLPFHNCETRYSLAALPFLYFAALKPIVRARTGRRPHRPGSESPA